MKIATIAALALTLALPSLAQQSATKQGGNRSDFHGFFRVV